MEGKNAEQLSEKRYPRQIEVWRAWKMIAQQSMFPIISFILIAAKCNNQE